MTEKKVVTKEIGKPIVITKPKKNWFPWVVGLVIVLILASIAFVVLRPQIFEPAPPDPATATYKELQMGKPFRFTGNNLQWPGRKVMLLGFFDACKDLDVLCEDSGVPGTDDATAIQSAELAISQGASGIVGNMYSQWRSAYQKGIDLGIPTISVHTKMKVGEMPGLIGWSATDVASYGLAAGEAIAAKTECKGTIAVTQSGFNDVENSAVSSFAEGYKAKCPEGKILESQEQGLELVAAIAKDAAIITANPDLTGAFCSTGGGPASWAEALKASGKKPGDVAVISMDATRAALDMVSEGWIYGLIDQPLYGECYKAVEVLAANLKKQPFTFDNQLPAPIVTVTEIDKYYEMITRAEALP